MNLHIRVRTLNLPIPEKINYIVCVTLAYYMFTIHIHETRITYY